MSSICDDLRAAILQAAMQGKLTGQLPEDGDAALLVEQIRSENSSLVRKKKKTSEVTPDEIPFKIPSNWSWIHTGDVCSIISGTSYSKKDLDSDGIRIFRGGNVPDGGELTSLDDDVFVSKELEDREKQPNKNDVVIVASTGSQKVIGKPCIVLEDTNGQIGAFLRIIRPFELINPKYFWCYMRSSLYRETISSLAKGTNINNIKNEYILNNIFPLPPFAEQERIVEKVDELMARVADLEQSADALASLKKAFPDDIKASILQAAMQGKLTEQLPEDGDAEELLDQIKAEKEKLISEGKIKKQKPLAPIADDEIPFSIPENWRWVRFGDVNELISGTDLTPDNYSSKPDGILYITGASNIQNGHIIQNRWTKNASRISKKGDLLLTCKGTVGTTAILDAEEAHIARQIMAIRPIRLDVNYIKLFIDYMVPTLKSAAKSMIPGIERGNVLNMLLPLPPLVEQKRIVKRLDTFMQNINVVGVLIASE